MERRKQLIGKGFKSIPVIAIAIFLWSWGNSDSPSKTIQFRGKSFDTYTVQDIRTIRFYLNDSSGVKLNTFETLKTYVNKQHQDLLVAVNGGMFTPSYEPQGLYVENGTNLHAIDTGEGYGNFFLMPNGVFAIANNKAFVSTTKNYLSNDIPTQYATQSGPMLVLNDSLHPAFRDGSKNLNIRNGVGVTKSGKVIFAISNDKTNFYDFALMFRDELECPNALYLDGAISKMYNKTTKRNEDGRFGVMIGVVK